MCSISTPNVDVAASTGGSVGPDPGGAAARRVLPERVELRVDKEHVLELLLTDRAVYWRSKKAFALVDDTIVMRAPYEELRLTVTTRRPWSGLLLGLPCLAFGAVWIYEESLKDGAAPLAVGLALVLFGSKRRVLRIESPAARYTWKAPVIFDRRSRRGLDAALARIAQVAGDHGAQVEWSGPPPPPRAGEPRPEG